MTGGANSLAPMKPTAILLLLLGISASVCRGQRLASPTVTPAAILFRNQNAQESISITFLTAPNGAIAQTLGSGHGLLNLGSVSCFSRPAANGEEIQDHKNDFTVSTRFEIRIGDVNAHRAGTVSVSALLLSSDPLRVVQIDGVRLSLTPQIIKRRVPYGVISDHVFEITIPTSDPAGQLSESISIIASPN
jgi:hypothetical protein